MNSLQSALNTSQGSDYVKNPDLFFNICHEVHQPPCSKKEKSTYAGIISLS